jgi:phosphomannomutase/phosphoglucomutase
VKFSDHIPAAAKKLGAEPVAERSGHAFIRTRMIETRALFGAEVSGHYFFGELEGGDDGLFCACRMIAHLAHSGQTLSELRRECPAVTMTPDLRLPVDPGKGQEVIEQVRAAWSEYPQSTVDGVRIDFPDGWVLLRCSVTEPSLTCRFEAADFDTLDRLVHRFSEKLPGLGEDLWDRYEEAMHPGG